MRQGRAPRCDSGGAATVANVTRLFGREEELRRTRALLEAARAGEGGARSRLALGERLRRSRNVRASREQLSAALSAFEAASASPWAERTRAELRASGQAGAAAPNPEAWDELTPHELRVALLVAEGRTNSEVATQLFVTCKTIEHHLSRVYRKLGLRGRTELARALASEAAPA